MNTDLSDVNHLQVIFDKVATHLLKQRVKSIGAPGGCMYRGDNGTACAVGCLITYENYKSSFEGRGSMYEPVIEAVEKSLGFGLSKELQDFLYALQGIHDRDYPYSWRRMLAELAVMHNQRITVAMRLVAFVA